MPIQRCTLPEGGEGYRWGSSGHCYADRADAEKQAQAAYANGYNGDAVAAVEDSARVALDRASVRRYDQDGHLFIEVANLSASCVSPYNATEIPDWDKLGLDRNKVYYLLRDPKSLADSAQSFCGKPLLFGHRPISADDHPHKIVVGAIGNDVRYEEPFLKGSLSIWDRAAIDAVESGEAKDISLGYYYQAVMEPGVHNGTPFDGRMVDLQANHAALVPTGRVPGAMVGDSAIPLVTIPETPAEATPQPATKPQPSAALDQKASPRNFKDLSAMPKANASLSRQALLTSGALRAYLLPKMAADAQIDLNPILKPVTSKNWQAQKPKIKTALDKALEGKLAQDADLEDLLGLLDALEDIPEATAAVDEDPDDDDDDEDEKKRKAKEAAEKLKEAADKKGAKDRKSAKDESDDDDDDDGKKKSASDEGEEDDDDDDDDEEEKKRKAKEAAEKLKEAAKDRKGAKDKAKGMDAEPTVTKAAMDAAIASAVKIAADSAAKAAEASTIARLRAIADAEKAVRPYIGELAIACDSAADVYRLALDAAGVDLDGVPEAAFPAMVKLLPKPGDQAKPVAKTTRIAADSAQITARQQMFPNANRLRSAH